MSINWQSIKSFNTSQNNAFEELVCQLAREELIPNKKEFYRVAAPDGGVEAYCVLLNDDEYGWQAKYFSSMGESQWNQIASSFKTALSKHPKLTRYYVCIPLDRQDPRDGKDWFMDKWNQKIKAWTTYAAKQGRNIEFEYWGSSELTHRLSEEKLAGRRNFWFSKDEFSNEWFKEHIENSILNLGHRYTPELNFDLDIAKNFDALSRNSRFQDHFKNQLHLLLKQFNKLETDIRTSTEIKNFLECLDKQLELSQKTELAFIEVGSLKNECISVEKFLLHSKHQIKSNDEGKKSLTEASKTKIYRIEQAINALFEFQEVIQSPMLALANLPVMLLSGEAGIGKSHLLADVASKQIQENKACVLLLGQHFSSEESPWTQILRNILRLNGNEKELLGALDAKAQAQGERLLFFVDAINEGKGRYFWPDHIAAFIKDFSQYPWLGLVLSIRDSYQELLTPKSLIPDHKSIRIVHQGFEGVEYQASSFFFAQHGIDQPSIPLLHPEFRNPLFLKLFCDGLNRSGHKRIPKGYGGITSIIDFFLSSIDEKLSQPAHFDYQPAASKKLVKKVIYALVKHKIENDLNVIQYESAIEIANPIISKYSNKKGFIDSLISEGVLTKNIYGKKHDEEIVYFAYERFEDHLTAAYLLEKHLDAEYPNNTFQDNGKLSGYIKQSYQFQGIIEAFSIQLPEKTGKELYELVPDDKKSRQSIAVAFVKSLLWRKPETITDKVLTFINQHVVNNDRTFDLFFQTLYSVAADPEHYFNANRLHRFLMKFSMTDRDEIWTTYLHDKDDTYEEVSSMQRLIDWAVEDGNKDHLSDESRLLVGKALSWLFTSTNIAFRDSATNALVCVLKDHIPTITQLLTDFNDVNDPYVYERILAAAYGAVLNSTDINGLTELSEYVLNTLFRDKEEVYPNILVRDYARNIVEYALYKKLFNLDIPEIIRPPYKSRFPYCFPTNEEIDAYEYDPDGKECLGQAAILRSMVTEYGRGICRYGDFGRYTFQSKFHQWNDKLDPNDLSNYACKLIVEHFGYDNNKHGRFDRYASSGDRHTNKKERIGKKYQWLSLYELLARVSDNYQMRDPSTGWRKEQTLMWYQGPWEPFVRNIDPTFIGRKMEKPSNHDANPWLQKTAYQDWQDTHQNWLVNSNNLPDPKAIIEVNDFEGNDWLILEIHPAWDEPVPVGYEQNEYSHKNLRYQIRSYFVHEDEAEQLIPWASEQHLMGELFHGDSEQYTIFSREYYWSPAYKFFDNPYYGRSQWNDLYEDEMRRKIIGQVMITTESHIWESGGDHQETTRYYAPRELVFAKINLIYSEKIGEWLNDQGEIVCFDPSVNRNGDKCLVIRKDVLSKFLADNKLKIFWLCSGEKHIYGDSFNKIKISKWLELSGVYSIEGEELLGNLNPKIQINGSKC